MGEKAPPPSGDDSPREELERSATGDFSLLQELAAAPALAAVPAFLHEDDAALPETIGRFRILGEVGRGGMGLVLRARDATLDRDVALKLLPGAVGREDSVRRFHHEAKAASSLNHPHIVTIYEIGQESVGSGTVHFIAMELIEGETLGDWLARERPTLSRILRVLAQVCAGLAKAHAAGIVHRDLKPANIMITSDGFAKILDFGLAKLVGFGPPGVGSQERAPLTRTGTVLGTAAYMSPEQIEGKDVDARSDIFSLGAVLYEAFAGKRPFAGKNQVEVMYGILHGEAPALRSLQPDLPEELERITHRCLAVDPEERYQNAQDLGLDLEQIRRSIDGASSGSISGLTAAMATPSMASSRRRRLWLVGGALVLAVAAVVPWVIPRKGQESTTPSASPPLRSTRLTFSGKTTSAAISGDGKVVAHTVDERGRQAVWVRQVATPSSIRVVAPAVGGVMEGPIISADGNYVYYTWKRPRELIGELFRVPILGGAPRKLISDVDSRAAPSPDGRRLAFVRHSPKQGKTGVFTIRNDGSEQRRIATYPFAARFAFPAWSPDGKLIAGWASRQSRTRHRIVAFPVTGGPPRFLSDKQWLDISGLAWLQDGRGLLVSASDQGSRFHQLWHVAYPSGATRRVTNDASHYQGVSVSAEGRTVVTVVNESRASLWVARADQGWRAEQWTTGSSRFLGVDWSSRGEIFYSSLRAGAYDIWVLDRRGATPRRLTRDAGSNAFPEASPDGKTVAFVSDRGGSGAIWLMDRDGGRQRRLTKGPILPGWLSFTPDSRWLVFTSLHLGKETLSRISLATGKTVSITDYYSSRSSVSPTGKRLAAGYWDGKLSSPWKLAIIPFAGGAPERTFQPPRGWDSELYWTPDGRALSYVARQEGVSNVWLFPLSGKSPRQLTSFRTGVIFWFARHPQQEKVVMAHGTMARDAVLIRNWRSRDTIRLDRGRQTAR